MSVYTYLSNVQIAIIGNAEPDVTKVCQFFSLKSKVWWSRSLFIIDYDLILLSQEKISFLNVKV